MRGLGAAGVVVLAVALAVAVGGAHPAAQEAQEAPESVSQPSVTPPVPVSYGVDVAFPVHHELARDTWQAKRFDHFIQGCYRRYSQRSCDANEQARKGLNLAQPKTQVNYTATGFAHLKLPSELFGQVAEFWAKHQDQQVAEEWPAGNTYTNHWEEPTFMVSLEDRRLREGLRLKRTIWDGVQPLLEEWTGQKLRPSSLYGVRVYKRGAMLASHVDRLPLVTSAIINVAQDVEDPWPVEVYDHSGHAHNVSMKPGDVVLYESHTVVHGRPAPLNGSYYANIFVHFMPVDEDGNDLHVGSSESLNFKRGGKGQSGGGHEQHQHANHEIAAHHDEGEDDEERTKAMFATGSTPLHLAAARGDLDTVTTLLAAHHEVNDADMNNWFPIHEAARGGHLDVMKTLVDNGADIGARTLKGGTPLWWARHVHGDNNSVVSFLESIGAPDLSESDEL